MEALLVVGIIAAVVAGMLLALSIKVVKQYERGVLFRLGRVHALREPGLTLIVPVIDVLRKVSLRTVTMPIQSQGIITKDNVSIDVAGVAYFHVVDAERSVVEIENVASAVNQIAQTTLRNVVGQHTLDQALSETDAINANIREILDRTTTEWGVLVTLVELKDIQLPESMKRAMARQAEAERERRAKIIHAEGEFQASERLKDAALVIEEHPIALQLRYLQTLLEIGGSNSSTIIFPAPIDLLKPFLDRPGGGKSA
jgi:regulator of protease activity HflC (stomatin/prohibitin superfamily)